MFISLKQSDLIELISLNFDLLWTHKSHPVFLTLIKFCKMCWIWSLVFWDIALCSQVEVDWSFRDAYCLHHQGDHHPDDGGSMHSQYTRRCENMKCDIIESVA
jgi:hypothetical protein